MDEVDKNALFISLKKMEPIIFQSQTERNQCTSTVDLPSNTQVRLIEYYLLAPLSSFVRSFHRRENHDLNVGA